MNVKHPLSVLTLTLTPFFMATGCSSTGGQHMSTELQASEPIIENQQLSDSTLPEINDTESTENVDSDNAEHEASFTLNDSSTLDTEAPIEAHTEAPTKDLTETLAETDAIESQATELVANNEPRPAKLVFPFGFNKSELSDDEKTIIKNHGSFLASHPSQSIVIHGHSDTQGDPRYNQFLSEKRAQHVAKLLKDAGAQDNQIEIFSWSSDSPADIAANYKANRRVELRYGQDYFAQKQQ